MPKVPNSWPPGALPRMMTRENAAYHCGISPNVFDQRVKDGMYPGPEWDGRYDRKKLDQALDELNGTVAPAPRNDDWSVIR